MANAHLKLVAPTIKKRTVTPKRAKNSELRTREHLTEHEVEMLMGAARQSRYGHRDATMILIAFRHGLRVSELVDLRWDQVDFNRAVLHVLRSGVHLASTPERIGATGPSSAATRERVQRVRISKRAARAVYHSRICKDDGAGSGGRRA
jgi:integrase